MFVSLNELMSKSGLLKQTIDLVLGATKTPIARGAACLLSSLDDITSCDCISTRFNSLCLIIWNWFDGAAYPRAARAVVVLEKGRASMGR